MNFIPSKQRSIRKLYNFKNYYSYENPKNLIEQISHRLLSLQSKKPNGILIPISWGWFSNKGSHGLSVDMPLLDLQNLSSLRSVIRKSNEGPFPSLNSFKKHFEPLLLDWREKDFIHGDLNLDNIFLIHKKSNFSMEFICIDYILEIKSLQGTPAFQKAPVYPYQKTFLDDQDAILKISRHLECCLNK